ncbi:MAG: type II toxin-antitoxin system HigB family toxin [Caldilineaceae bacterium]
MHIITQKTLRAAWEEHPDAERPLRQWYTEMKNLNFTNLAELRQHFLSADQVGRLTVFNLRGNHYRLVVRIDYTSGKVFIRRFMTHAEYDREDWKNDPWY